MSKDNLIVAQCCFKGAIDLAVANKITVEEINDMTATFTEAILGKYGNGMVTQVETPAKPVFNLRKTTTMLTLENQKLVTQMKMLVKSNSHSLRA